MNVYGWIAIIALWAILTAFLLGGAYLLGQRDIEAKYGRATSKALHRASDMMDALRAVTAENAGLREDLTRAMMLLPPDIPLEYPCAICNEVPRHAATCPYAIAYGRAIAWSGLTTYRRTS